MDVRLDRPTTPPSPDWLIGSGEMRERIRSFDWSQTPLGPIDQWTQSLRTAGGARPEREPERRHG